jgi:Flp pilus assembly protein TadB
MRFPSFIRLPRHQRFHYEPRYYDPIKEDLDQRTKLIKKQLTEESNASRGERISAQWKRKERQSQKSSVLQLIILAVLVITVVAYFYLGNAGIYGVMGIFAAGYLLFKLKQMRKAD